MKKKLNLRQLRVKSFVTDMNPEVTNTAKGGDRPFRTLDEACSIGCTPPPPPGSDGHTECTVCFVFTADCGGPILGI